MDYEKFCKILNKHIFEGEKKELLQRIAEGPERFIGLFRPTRPAAKILQHLLQSHEIRFGDAMEEAIEEVLKDKGYAILPKTMIAENGETLSLDQYFMKDGKFYFVEQKVRDDHDSTKKRGQLSNFESKIEVLIRKHSQNLTGIMYFIDPDLTKNKNYYQEELNKLEKFYNVKLYLFYGKELFDYLQCSSIWDDMLLWLNQWKDSLPELPEINFDTKPHESLKEIKDLEIRYWRKILENEKLWREGILKAMFKEGTTLRLLSKFFHEQNSFPYKILADLLDIRLEQFY